MISWFRVSPDVAWIEVKSLFIELVILVWTMDLADFKTQTRRISLFCHFFFSCINTVYSLFYGMHTEKEMDWYSFLVIHDMVIAAIENISLEDNIE